MAKRRNRRQDKHLRRAKKMAAMRAAKERKRMAREPVEREPRFTRWHRLEIGLRDTVTGDVAWVSLRSARQARTIATLALAGIGSE